MCADCDINNPEFYEACVVVTQAKEELMSLMDTNNNSGVRGLADMDTRLSKLNKRIVEMEDVISRLEKVMSEIMLCQ